MSCIWTDLATRQHDQMVSVGPCCGRDGSALTDRNLTCMNVLACSACLGLGSAISHANTLLQRLTSRNSNCPNNARLPRVYLPRYPPPKSRIVTHSVRSKTASTLNYENGPASFSYLSTPTGPHFVMTSTSQGFVHSTKDYSLHARHHSGDACSSTGVAVP